MLSLSHALRVGRHLSSVWQTTCAQEQQATEAACPQLEDRLESIQRIGGQLARAKGHGLSLMVPRLSSRLAAVLGQIQGLVGELRPRLLRVEEPGPSPPMLYQELRQLEAEFDSVEVDWKKHTLQVTTEPITLEAIELGAFAIRFAWDQMLQGRVNQRFEILALEPNPAISNEHVTHPHVRDNTLCAGDAELPLRHALEQGRLADACCLIRSVLSTYNASSPYVSLDDWLGSACSECGRSMSEEERTCCDACQEDFCDDCFVCCASCEGYSCVGCLMSCAVCEDRCCASCLQPSSVSGRKCCSSCRVPCGSCAADLAKDECSEEDQLCPDCLAQQTAEDHTDFLPPAAAQLISSVPLEFSHASTPKFAATAAG